MTAVANPPSFQQINRSAWGSSQGGMNADSDVARMFMPRKSAQRSNSSSSIASSSSSSSTTTIAQSAPQTNGVSMPVNGDLSAWGTQGAAKRKPQRAGPWPTSKAEAMSGVSTARPQSILTPNGTSATSSMSSIHQPAPMVPSQHLQNPGTQQTNGNRGAVQPVGEGNPVLYLLSMNGTFERKTISVPYYPDSIRIGRQTNVKTLPTPTNGFFDSKVLSRQHAEIWADRNGKVWIRDVKSSNGTFVNGARLSPENRDSEPHELQSQDHLELGIDIVSEDQKTVVHHKVAAKVEHAGFLGTTNNVMDMNFGDLDPANGTMMLPSQSGMPFRGRSGSQGSVQSNGRIIPAGSLAGSQMTGMNQPRPMNFWLTPVTTEQIVKRLTHEMRTARLQTSDLGRTDGFIASILSKDEIKANEKPAAVDPVKPPQLNGTSLPFRVDPKPRFSDPPAPPPQQPLPEKPDSARSQVATDPSSPASLKRSNTERPRSVPNGSPQRQEPTSQIITLVEALASAKKELDSQSARMRDLEEMLQKERQARETAEETARKFELQTSDLKTNGHAKGGVVTSVLEEAFEPPLEILETPGEQQNGNPIDAQAMSDSASLLEKQLEAMMVDMEQMKQQMETFKTRAETAEAERDEDRKTLAEMVQKIRLEETARRSTSTERGSSPSTDGIQNHESSSEALLGPLLHKSGLSNGAAIGSAGGRPATGTLARPPGGPDPLMYQSAPYASILGVVLIGMGLMAYLNGWQPPKVDR